MTSTLIYYVYIYRHPLTNVPFYVGYGKNGRSASHLLEAKRKPDPISYEHKLNEIWFHKEYSVKGCNVSAMSVLRV